MASGGLGAGAAGADMLMQVLQQKLQEQQVRQQQAQFAQKIAEEARQANLRDAIDQGQLGLGRGRLGLDEKKLGEDSRQFDVTAGQRDRTIKLDEEIQPVRIKHVGAQTDEILRKPMAEQQDRDFTMQRDESGRKFTAGENAKNRAHQTGLATIRHPDAAGPAQTAQSQREQNEVEDSLALVKQIREDQARSIATGPIQGRGLGAVQDLEGYTRVKALHDNLVNKMQLAQAGKLKGQGQISNMEREMLKNAATALDRKLGDADYLNELAKVEQQFQRMLTGPRTVNAPGGAPKGSGFKVVEIK
jgi:hypothetical protein